MHLKVKQELLSSVLANLTKATAPRSPIPALRGILLVTGEDELILNASDGELTIRARIPAEILDPGTILLPADSLAELVRHLEPSLLELAEERKEEGAGVVLRWDTGQTKIWIMEAENYPPLIETTESTTPFTCEELRSAILKTLPATSKEDAPSKAILRGVHLTVANNRLLAEATDGIRLAVWKKDKVAEESQEVQFDAVLPLRAVFELARFTGRESEILLAHNENHLIVKWREGEMHYLLTSRRVNGRYPNTSEYIPSAYVLRFSLPKNPFIAAVERAMIINRMDNQTYPVKIRVDGEKNELVVSAISASVGTYQERIILDHWEGETFETAFNARYLVDGLKLVEQDTIHFSSAGIEGPAMITGESTSSFYLLLPLRLG